MKVLDVQPFQEGLQRNIEMLNRLEAEITVIEQTVEGLVAMEETFKGQGGSAIRAFYQECHLPFLQFFKAFKSSFSDILSRMATALHSFEPHQVGYIRQVFLEGEIQQGLDIIEQITESLTTEANNLIDSVADIVYLPHLDDSEVQDSITDGERRRDDTVEGLIEFDHSQNSALTTVATDLMVMERWIIDIESMMTEGLADVNFPAEAWKAVTSRHPLQLSLAARNSSLMSVAGASPFYDPGLIFGANPYALPGMYSKAQPLHPLTGIYGADVSTMSLLYSTAGEQIANSSPYDYDPGNNLYAMPGMATSAIPLHPTYGTSDTAARAIVKTSDGEEFPDSGLSCPVPVNIEKEEEKGFWAKAGDVAVGFGKGTWSAVTWTADFLVLDDARTILDPDASAGAKGLALAGFIPVGKVLKGGKLAGEAVGIGKKADNVADKAKDSIKSPSKDMGEESVTYRRVQGGEGTKQSQERVVIDDDGNVYINNKDKNLNISIDNGEHARHFLENNRNNADLYEFEVPKWFDDFVKENTIPQAGYKKNPLNQGGTAPKLTDPSTPGTSIEFPEPWADWIEEHATNGRIKKGGK